MVAVATSATITESYAHMLVKAFREEVPTASRSDTAMELPHTTLVTAGAAATVADRASDGSLGLSIALNSASRLLVDGLHGDGDLLLAIVIVA